MGVVNNVGYDTFPPQSELVGKKVLVCFNYDPLRTMEGEVVRDDTEEPGCMIFKLDDGRYVLATECMYRPLNQEAKSDGPRVEG